MSPTPSGRRPGDGPDGERLADASEFESGLDYAAYVDDEKDQDPDRTVVLPRRDDAAAAAPTTGEAGHQATATLSREDLDRMRRADEQARSARSRDVAASRPVTAPTPQVGGTRPAPGGVATQAFSRSRRDPDGRLPAAGPRLAQVLLALLAPVVLLIGVVRLVASPVFLWLEYRRPGFPADAYGFTAEDRLHYGSAGLDFLFNASGARYLQQLQDGGRPVFTEAEVAHMVDVKIVMLASQAAGVLLAVVCALLVAYLLTRSAGGVRRALCAGAAWFLVAMVALAVLGVLGWESLFTAFHQLFFADGTWTFAASDGLIRLYPGQFWIDAALAVALLSLAAAVATLVLTWPTRRRREAAWDRRLQMEATRGRWYREDHAD